MTPRISYLVAAGVKQVVAEKWIEAIKEACATFEINTPQRIASFLAQCAHESGGFTMLTENLNYSADTMAAVWPNRFAVKGPDGKYVLEKGKKKPNKFALALHRKPESIANVVYANRMANGPTESGDGWKFRGRGLKQLTGKDNYTRCGQALGVDLVSNPDLLTTPKYAALSACWFWRTNNLNKFADAGDLEGMTKKINGGLIGFQDRKQRCDAALACMRSSDDTSNLA
jgi:putative chitinase